jgi:hypothetical protein
MFAAVMIYKHGTALGRSPLTFLSIAGDANTGSKAARAS